MADHQHQEQQGDCKPAPPSAPPPQQQQQQPRTKKPDKALYVPKSKPKDGGGDGQAGDNNQGPTNRNSKQTPADKKGRPRPKYTDKAWKNNAKNKKHKSPKADEEAPPPASPIVASEGDPAQNGDCEDGETERGNAEKSEQQTTTTTVTEGKDSGESGSDGLSDRLTTSDTKAEGEGEGEAEEEEEQESWDTLFNDDGECLDPHLLEEVGSLCCSFCHTFTISLLFMHGCQPCSPNF